MKKWIFHLFSTPGLSLSPAGRMRSGADFLTPPQRSCGSQSRPGQGLRVHATRPTLIFLTSLQLNSLQPWKDRAWWRLWAGLFQLPPPVRWGRTAGVLGGYAVLAEPIYKYFKRDCLWVMGLQVYCFILCAYLYYLVFYNCNILLCSFKNNKSWYSKSLRPDKSEYIFISCFYISQYFHYLEKLNMISVLSIFV